MKRLFLILGVLGRTSLLAGLALLAAGAARGQVVINEIMADNQSIVTLNGIADFPDYIELHNTSGSPVNVAGWSLTDDPTSSLKYIIPAGTNAMIPAFGYLLVLGDKKTNSVGLHSGFGLGKLGGVVQLYTNDGFDFVVMDSVTYGVQIPDMSIGRQPNGAGATGTNFSSADWSLNRPTPGASNVAATLGDPFKLRINEWSAFNGTAVARPPRN